MGNRAWTEKEEKEIGLKHRPLPSGVPRKDKLGAWIRPTERLFRSFAMGEITREQFLIRLHPDPGFVGDVVEWQE